nr:hypothetical protein [uncultured Halomonas sp.]
MNYSNLFMGAILAGLAVVTYLQSGQITELKAQQAPQFGIVDVTQMALMYPESDNFTDLYQQVERVNQVLDELAQENVVLLNRESVLTANEALMIDPASILELAGITPMERPDPDEMEMALPPRPQSQ